MANESVWKRPKTDDDEEELLRQQEEFLKAKQQPSAKIINSGGSGIQSDISASCSVRQSEGKVKSQFSLQKSRSKREIVATSQNGNVRECARVRLRSETSLGCTPASFCYLLRSEQGQNDAGVHPSEVSERSLIRLRKSFGFPPHRRQKMQNMPIASSHIILGNIMEKKFDIEKYEFDDNHVSVGSELGFPNSFGFNNVKMNDNQSLFLQKVLARNKSTKVQKGDEFSCSDNKEEAYAIENRLINEIHKENIEKLAQMSKEEVLKEKRNLEETLDPNIIQFLKSKKNKKSGKRPVEQNDAAQHDVLAANDETRINTEVSSDKKIKISSNDSAKMDCEDDMSNIPESPKQILEEGKQKGWLHMDTPEPEKLKWMEDLPAEKKNEPAPNEEYNARFDFNGFLLPYKDETLTVDRGLHHHGEEPERPGYTLQELLQLSRSSTQQQRCTALTTLANIMEKTRKGWYDKVLHPSPLTALSQKNILLLLRFSLDDTSVAVVTAALQALRAFLYSEADEVCLDRLYGLDDGYAEPTLTPQLEDKDTSSLKDHELVQLDAVATLLRSDFLLRVRYILNEMHPSPIGVICALEILIRVARHSHITALNISSTPHLLDTIIHNFMPLSMDQLAMQDAINNAYGIPVVQAVKLCRVLVVYGKKPVAQKLNSFKVIQAILTYIRNETGRKDDINLGIECLRFWRILLYYEVGLDSIAGAKLILVSQLQLLLCNHDIQNASELACEHAAALVAVASRENTLKPNVSTLLTKWSTQLSLVTKITWGVMKLIAETLSAIDDVSAFRTTWLSNQHIFSMLRFSSNLLSNCNPATKREPSCLPNLDVLVENGEMQPIVSLNSCIPFLTTVLNTFHDHSRVTEIRALLEQPSFHKYMRDLETVEWSFERSWYSRTELHLLMAVVRTASLLSDTIDSATAQVVWKITIKLVSAIPADIADHAKRLLRIALSNERVNLEVVTNELAKLNLTSTVDRLRVGLRTDAASRLYEKYVSLNGDWSQAAMPKDWLFLPLVHVYTKCKSDVRLQVEDKDSIMTVLSLALILPDLSKRLSPSLRFSRLILVYLCDTVYLDEDVSALLVSVVSDLLRRNYARLNFRTELPGLTSFTDLFTALCEHFCSCSYGDGGFAMALLIPVAQRHDTHYRKLLWSEHAGTLRYLRLPPEKLVVPLREYFYPEEEDTSLIECYITALVRGTISEAWCPVPYAIAMHHSAMYLKRSNKLAVRLRTQMEKMHDRAIANKLLRYEPPQL